MNVLEAACGLGCALRKRDEAAGHKLLVADLLSELYGIEASVRLTELISSECAKYGFYGYDAAMYVLENLKDPNYDNDPITYWTLLRDRIGDAVELREYASHMKQIGIEAEDFVSGAFAFGGSNDSAKNEDPLIILASDCLCAAVKRTGVARRLAVVMSHLDEGVRKKIADAEKPNTMHYEITFTDIIRGRFASDNENIDVGIRGLVIQLVFVISLARKGIFWGYEDLIEELIVEKVPLKPGSQRCVQKIRIETDSPLVMLNKKFAAFKLMNGGKGIGYLLPERIQADLFSNSMRSKIEGVYYPIKDRDLMADDWIDTVSFED